MSSNCNWSDQLQGYEQCDQALEARLAQTVVDQVVDTLAGRIVGGDLRPGESLPGERVLSSELNVGRAPLREAISRLAQMGLVRVQQGQSSRITDFWNEAGVDLLATLVKTIGLTPDLMQSVLQARCLIGGNIARLAAASARDRDVRNLRQFLRSDYNDTVDDRMRRDIDFFALLVEASGNSVFRLLLNSVRQPFLDNEEFGVLVPAAQPQAKAHAAIVDAVADGDERLAVALTESYLSEGKVTYV